MANRYWVGGSGTWDASSTTNWATTSGGSSGASAPTSVDTVYFDANSGGGSVSIVTGAAANFINAFPYNGSLTFVNDWGTSLSLGTAGLYIQGEWTLTIPTGVTVRMNYVGLYGGTSTPSPSAVINGTLEVTEDCIINDSNTVYTPVNFSGSGEIVIGGDPSFPYLFMRRQTAVNVDIRFLCTHYSSMWVFDDGQATTIKKITKEGTAFFVFEEHNNQLTISEFVSTGGNILGLSVPLTIGSADIKRTTITDLQSATQIEARNSIDGGGNLNINFVQAPMNLSTTTGSIINVGLDLSFPWSSLTMTWAQATFTWDTNEINGTVASTALTNVT